MLKLVRAVAASLLIVFTFTTHGQSWVEMMDDPQYTVEEVREAYEKQWGHHPYVRGEGHKQFERWAHFMERRLGPNGERPDPTIAWQEMKKIKQKSAMRRGQNFQGNWQSLGPAEWVNHTSGYNPGLGRVNWVKVDPLSPQTIYITTPSGGVWKTSNSGTDWENLTDHLPVIGATGLAINPENNQSLLLGTGDGYGASTYSIGLLRSYDGGHSWDTTGLQFFVNQFIRISDVYYAPNDTNVIMVAASNGVYRSSDHGDSWTQVISSGNFRSLAYHPLNPDVVYAASNQFYKSEDGGLTFRQISNGLPGSNGTSRVALGVTPADSNRIYALVASSQTQGLRGFYRSDDAGESWVLKLDTPNILASDVNGFNERGQGWYDLCVAVSPTNPDQVFTGGVNIWQTSNGGDDFSLVTHWRYDNTNDPYVHADIHYMEYYGNYLYVGCDGGIFRTNNGGISWQDLSDGLEITQIYGMGLSPNFNNIMQFGSQDNGTYRWENGIWKHIFGADGMHTIIHPTNPNIVYISTQFGNLRRSTNGGSTFTRIMNNINETGLWVTPYIMHPTDPNTLYVGKDNLWRTTNGGFSFTQIAIGGKIRHIAQSESDPDVIYYTTGSRPFKTANGGTTWSMTTGGLPMGAGITDMKVGHKDPNVVYLTFGGYLELAKVFKSTDGGQNWVSIGDGLPNLPVNCLVEQKGEKERLYVGMDVGVYYWEEGMAEWEPFFDGMPNVIVNDLKIQYNIGTIRAGTYGRGVWESQLYHVNVSNETQTLKDNSKVYPNPASGQVFIESPEDAQVQMMGVDGSVIRNFSVINGQRFALDIGQIPGGVYVLKFETVKGSFTKKCVVQ